MCSSAFAISSSTVSPRTTWPHSQLISFAIAPPLVRQYPIVLERKRHQLRRQRRLRDAVRLEAARLARHSRDVEARPAGNERVVRLAQAARAESDEAVEHRLAQQLH